MTADITRLWTDLDDAVLASFADGPRKPIDVLDELAGIPEWMVRDTLRSLGRQRLLWADQSTKTLALTAAGTARLPEQAAAIRQAA